MNQNPLNLSRARLARLYFILFGIARSRGEIKMEVGEASILAPSVPASYATVARIGLGGTPPNMILCRWYNYTFFASL